MVKSLVDSSTRELEIWGVGSAPSQFKVTGLGLPHSLIGMDSKRRHHLDLASCTFALTS